jgi:hypothetical protein
VAADLGVSALRAATARLPCTEHRAQKTLRWTILAEAFNELYCSCNKMVVHPPFESGQFRARRFRAVLNLAADRLDVPRPPPATTRLCNRSWAQLLTRALNTLTYATRDELF